jgi:hypothetical protein
MPADQPPGRLRRYKACQHRPPGSRTAVPTVHDQDHSKPLEAVGVVCDQARIHSVVGDYECDAPLAATPLTPTPSEFTHAEAKG